MIVDIDLITNLNGAAEILIELAETQPPSAQLSPKTIMAYAGTVSVAARVLERERVKGMRRPLPAADDEPEPKKAKRSAEAQCPKTESRHRYGDGGVCECGAAKRGAKVDPPSHELPGVAANG